MKESQLFIKTRREAPKDEVAKNAQLLIRAGFVHKEMAGVYSYLPLGLKTLEKIIALIRREMNAAGGEEVLLSSLQEKSTWEPTDQWDEKKVDAWFKTELKNGTQLGLALTHEAAITKLMKSFVSSYRDLPRALYQFQTKFRNEERAKSGILRCREFLMKDLYYFARDEKEQDEFYERMKAAYRRIFDTAGIGRLTYLTVASGGMFSRYSHEFQTVCEAGEDTIYLDEEKKVAVNLEVCTDEVLGDLGLRKDELLPRKAIEVGNIFKLGTRFADALGLKYRTEAGDERPVMMSSYGLGPGRLLGTIAETLSDDRGLVWPAAIAPFAVHLLALGAAAGPVAVGAAEIYRQLTDAGVATLWDDRERSAGEKFAESDLLGLPWRLVVSDKALAAGRYELRERATGETVELAPAAVVKKIISDVRAIS